jgi:hypothetical protein
MLKSNCNVTDEDEDEDEEEERALYQVIRFE